jgi:polysaccharide pyruvyl transferase WcaK-like protein
MNSLKFLIYGISGVYNYGCEAIVRGTEIILREVWPNAVIKYASSRPEDDSRRLKDTQIEILPRKRYSRYSVRNIYRKCISMAGFSWTPIMESLDIFCDCDVVLSIGGDLYTMRTKGAYPSELLKTGEYILLRGKVFVIWGGSVGPFNKKVEELFKTHLQKVNLITSREAASTAYLKTLGIQKNVIACADPAYVVYPTESYVHRLTDSLRIGINLSPLSSRTITDQKIEVTLVEQAQTVANLVRQLDADIVFIPHVVDHLNERDDDLRYMRKIIENLPDDVANKVELYDEDLGFLGAKTEIRKCHIIIAARMHCSINAISAGVPTILVSYSQKAVGMAEYVYGSRKWVIPIKEFNSLLLINLVKDMLSEYSFIADYLKYRIPYIQDDARNAGIALAELLN